MHAAYRPSEDLAGLAVTSFPSLHVQLALPGLAVTNFPHFACSAGPSRTGSYKLSTLCMFSWPFLDWELQTFHTLHVQLALPGLGVTNFPHFACSAGPSRTGSCLSTLHVELALPGPVSLTLWGSMYSFLFLFSVCCK